MRLNGKPRCPQPFDQDVGQSRFVSRGVRGLDVDALTEECQGFLLVHEHPHEALFTDLFVLPEWRDYLCPSSSLSLGGRSAVGLHERAQTQEAVAATLEADEIVKAQDIHKWRGE
jgi:hypothetical protein